MPQPSRGAAVAVSVADSMATINDFMIKQYDGKEQAELAGVQTGRRDERAVDIHCTIASVLDCLHSRSTQESSLADGVAYRESTGLCLSGIVE